MVLWCEPVVVLNLCFKSPSLVRIKAWSTISKEFTAVLCLLALKLVNKHRRIWSGGRGGEVAASLVFFKIKSSWCRSVSIIDVIQGSLWFTNIVLSSSMLATPVKTISLIIVTCFVNNSIPTAHTHVRTRTYDRHFNKGTYTLLLMHTGDAT